jgi:hypothetical protein
MGDKTMETSTITTLHTTDKTALFEITSWDGNVYTVKLERIGRYRPTGGEFVQYRFYQPGAKRPLFSGDDFGTSPMDAVLSEASAMGLLGFLTCQPGDTDDDFFKGYTPKQREWAESYECECLGGVVSDYENGPQG